MGRRSKLEALSPAWPTPLQLGGREAGLPSISRHCPLLRSRLSGGQPGSKAVPGWAVRWGEWAAGRRCRKDPVGLLPPPRCHTHTTLSKPDHKTRSCLGHETPSGPESPAGQPQIPIMCPSVLPLFLSLSRFAWDQHEPLETHFVPFPSFRPSNLNTPQPNCIVLRF